jgi:GT2 family glycosyltransferase
MRAFDGFSGNNQRFMRASVVIPNLDCPLVDRAVRSVLEQRAPGSSLQVVVVGRAAPGTMASGPGFRHLAADQQLSPAAARNLGVSEVSGELLLFIDADCVAQPGWAEALIAAAEESPVVGGSVTFDLSANRWAVADNIASFSEFLDDRPAEASTDRPLGSLNLAIRRSAWEEVGPFDEELVTSEDHDWVLRARAAGLETAFAPEAVVQHAAVRSTLEEVEAHARWYGEHFAAFRRRHPGVFDSGPTWRSKGALKLAAPLKARLAARSIFREHPSLEPARDAFEGVFAFKRAWYQAVIDGWEDA